MTQIEKRLFLIQELLKEQPNYPNRKIPKNATEQKKLLRSLLNIRRPKPASKEFLQIQDAYLQNEIKEKGITHITELAAIERDIYLWQGDITTLCCDAIVNAANSQLLGCFHPCHGCIDNAIHTYAGVQLRLACEKLMQKQGHEEPIGGAKITPAYNLPCQYVIHTVGPVVYGSLTQKERDLLASCYRSCLELAEKNNINSIAFCCISTGEFHFPNDQAAQIAVATVKLYKKQTNSNMKIIFNVYKDNDWHIYQKLLG